MYLGPAEISVLILTRNEQLDLPGCLESVKWSGDIHVLDSFSTDSTTEIAARYGAHVSQRVFDGYASQRNFGLSLPFRNEWVLLLDADERVDSVLLEEMVGFINSPGEFVAARLQRRDFWWGRWLKHAQISPYFVRLVIPRRVAFEREVNEILRVDGAIYDLKSPFTHFPFSKGLDQWIDKHNRYSRMEAIVQLNCTTLRVSSLRSLFSRDFNRRREVQKAVFNQMPCRPLIKLVYMLFVRRAFLDGWPGVRYSILQAIYEYLIVLKIREQRDRGMQFSGHRRG